MGKFKYIVIGGRGYIGKEIYASLSTKHDVLRTASTPADGYIHFRLEKSDDFENISINYGDIIFFAAAISSPDLCSTYPEKTKLVNVTQTCSFIRHAISRGARVIFFSSDTVYGEREDTFIDIGTVKPAGEYAFMKTLVEKTFQNEPLFKSVRLSYVFSREDKFTQYLINCENHTEEAEIYHPFIRSVVHRDDVVNGVISLANNWDCVNAQFINFGGPDLQSRIDITKCLKALILKKLRYRVIEPPKEFFMNRPKIIAMRSPVLSELLGRSPRRLDEAMHVEFEN